MAELEQLLETAGGQCIFTAMQNRSTPDPRTFIGEGKAREIAELVRQNQVDLLVFDNEISPSQTRALEEIMQCRVIDRNALILDIFADRAKTSEGKLQVELAQYQYLLPRLSGMWSHLVRQTAGGGRSPIGTRGPGETQLETDRRHIRQRIARLQRGAGKRAPDPRHPAAQTAQAGSAIGGPGGVYQCGQIHPAQRADGRRRPCQRPAVRHAGPHHEKLPDARTARRS